MECAQPSRTFVFRDPHSPDGKKIAQCANAIIGLLRDRDDSSEIMFWGLCNAIVSLMAIEPQAQDFMRDILCNFPWDKVARERREERELLNTPAGSA
jgi:hypothetical protein